MRQQALALIEERDFREQPAAGNGH